MELGMVGLGRMGFDMARRLLTGGHRVAAWDRDAGKTAGIVTHGGAGATSLDDLVGRLAPPRHLWVMLPAGAPTGDTIARLGELLSAGDLVVDGGNSHYKDSVDRAAALGARGIGFLDVGTSGGIWGLRNGYCLMAGGPAADFRRMEPALSSLAAPDGYAHVGPAGAGHYAKMVHNGIEYALMESYAEGFELLRASGYEPDLAALARLWNHGSVVRSWLLELAEQAFARDPGLSGVGDWVDDSGEGRWTVLEALERDVPAPAITLAVLQRLRSRQRESFGAKVIAALRHEFGGHATHRPGKPGSTGT